VRSHSLLATLLGQAEAGRPRAALARTLAQAAARRGLFAGSQEDLTPLALDPLSAVPLAVVAAQLLLRPSRARAIASQSIANYALSPAAVRAIEALGAG
jgi:hypothetical protein